MARSRRALPKVSSLNEPPGWSHEQRRDCQIPGRLNGACERHESACRELDKTLRANVPKVSAVGTSPTSALPCVVSRSSLPIRRALSRKCFSLSFDSGNSGSGFL